MNSLLIIFDSYDGVSIWKWIDEMPGFNRHGS